MDEEDFAWSPLNSTPGSSANDMQDPLIARTTGTYRPMEAADLALAYLVRVGTLEVHPASKIRELVQMSALADYQRDLEEAAYVMARLRPAKDQPFLFHQTFACYLSNSRVRLPPRLVESLYRWYDKQYYADHKLVPDRQESDDEGPSALMLEQCTLDEDTSNAMEMDGSNPETAVELPPPAMETAVTVSDQDLAQGNPQDNTGDPSEDPDDKDEGIGGQEKLDICEDTETLYYIAHQKYREGWSLATKSRVRKRAKRYEMKDSKLYKIMDKEHTILLVPPIQQREQIAKHIHNASHFGAEKVYKTLRQRYWWSGMYNQGVNIRKMCTDCAQVLTPMNAPAPSQPIPVLGKLHRWHVDLIGPLHRTPSGNSYIIMAVDSATKFAEAGAVSNKWAMTVNRWFYHNVVCRYGCPVEVVTDNGLEFAGQFASTLELLGINHRPTSTYHPQANGAVERLNGVVEKVITAFPDNMPWDEMLPSVMLSVRTAYHSSTKMSPAQALMGKELVLPGLLTMSVDIDYPCEDLQGTPDVDGFDADAVRVTVHHVQEVTKMQDTEVLLLENIKKAQAMQSKKSITVKRKRASHLATKQLPQVGGYAMLRINNPTKLGKRFENGVYKVVDFNASNTVVQLEDMNGLRWNESTDNIKKYP